MHAFFVDASRSASRSQAHDRTRRLSGCARAGAAGGRREAARGLHRQRRSTPSAWSRRSRSSRPGCASACCRTGKRCPTTSSRRTRTWCPSGSRRCTRSSAATSTSLIVPAPRRSARSARPSYPRRAQVLPQGEERIDRERCAAARRRRLQHVTQVVAPGRIQLPRRADRPVPDGQRAALPRSTWSTTRSRASAPSTSTPSARIYKVNEVRLLPAREFPTRRGRRAPASAELPREVRGRSVDEAPLQGRVATACPPPASSTTCRCSSSRSRRSSTICRKDTHAGAARRRPRGDRGVLARHAARATAAGGDPDRPLLPPQELFLPAEQFFARAQAFPRVDICSSGEAEQRQPIARRSRCHPLRWTAAPTGSARRAASVPRRLAARVLMAAERRAGARPCASTSPSTACSPAPCASFEDFPDTGSTLMLGVAPLANGFAVAGGGLGGRHRERALRRLVRAPRPRARRSAASVEGMLRDLSELKVGDPVVHEQHGIGRYLGLVEHGPRRRRRPSSSLLEYDGGDKLYVPVSQLGVIGRYSGAPPEAAPLHKLGSGQWDKAKRAPPSRCATPRPSCSTSTRSAPRARARVQAQAARLRGLRRRLPLRGDARPGGRHRCGDRRPGRRQADGPAGVRRRRLRQDRGGAARGLRRGGRRQAGRGAGAHHAARRAALPDLLRPLRRLAGEDRRAVALPLRQGNRRRRSRRWRTARSTSSSARTSCSATDVKFKNLGLVIIDEEHRFGVRQKEALKALRAEVDVLTLTATPIPRTLAMSLEGMRDFSVIATAPQRRLAIKTFVAPLSEGLIREAVLRELKRGGQVYFLHNEVETIERMRGAARRAGARGAHPRRPRPDARARAGARDARLLPAALQRAAVHDHHRDRHRHPHRQHHHHQPRRQVRPGAAAPAARPRRPLAPPGLRLSAHAARRRAQRAGARSAWRRSR